MRIIYLPIDERPCNTIYVERIAASTSDVELLLPPTELLGNKKSPADTEQIWEWILEQAPLSEALILSIDLLVYGGLLPSRLHYLPEETGLKWMDRMRMFHKKFPNIRIYASNLIMRTPKYSSSDEEPDYYEDWGREIFLNAFLQDKGRHIELTEDEKRELQHIKQNLPKQFVDDYESRRKFNRNINLQVLELINEGVISFLVIPQDDSAEYGYTAQDQNIIVKKREQLRLFHQVHIYPGADEVGATLLARVYNDFHQKYPKIFPIWSSTLGAQLIPMYEDRPFGESLKAHILASGCHVADSAETADIILAYNTPGRVMQEAWYQGKKDVTYSSFRNLLLFVEQMKSYLDRGKHVIVADSAYANGGDGNLITLLDEAGILEQLTSYKGWNTNCNTLGSTIAQGVLGLDGLEQQMKENIIYHILDDYFYQSEIRMKMVDDFLPEHNLTYFDLKDKADIVNQERDRRLLICFEETLKNSFQQVKFENLGSYAPWNRMFELGIDLKVKFN
ncbi:DUF4127 family protein [Paucisalibacillus sp. EB02]|uniref:DUF4127 family protein n=1 Tax=Paucisalibacillus sp. EB02 TaxID=1347087 RepID=UPI0004BA1E2F|nr:DUF4127 family protein [Paucisalibacillus sp. EB02]